MQTSIREVRITELDSSLDEIVKDFLISSGIEKELALARN
jgi:hypothetical protein